MFFLRGAFWVAMVAVFCPREADTGPANNAGRSASAVALIDNFRESTLATLSRVHAQFQAEDRARIGRGPPL